ncbi:MAG: M28 family peptidase [Pseudomonadota bacterium]
MMTIPSQTCVRLNAHWAQRRLRFLLWLLFPLPAACGVLPDSLFPQAVQHAGQVISESTIRADIAELSSDAYEGRAPGTRGDAKTQTYLINRLRNLGLTPGAADGGWRQRFDLVALHAQQPSRWTFVCTDATPGCQQTGSGQPQTFVQGTDFIVGSGVQAPLAEVRDAEVVFVGYGIQAPEYGWDDYKGVDVRGKILLMLNNDPHEANDLFKGETRLYYGRWTYKYEIAAALGAAGAIIVHTNYSAGYPWQVVKTSWTGPQYELPSDAPTTLQLEAWMTQAASARLVAMADKDLEVLTQAAQSRDFQTVTLGVRTNLSMVVDQQTSTSANILGLVPGSDPQLAQEVVVYTAHHDHLGMLPPDSGEDDLIYNGAMDNAAGVASTLSIAEAFAELQPAPRRSVLFVFTGAEEQGLLGSEFYARQPTFAPGNIAANINLDGGQVAGRSRNIAFIGYGRSTLDAVAEQAAAHQQRYVVGDLNPSAGLYYRSDHFSLARIGVPGLYFRGGTDLLDGGRERGDLLSRQYVIEHYHQTSDELSPAWQFDGLREDAQFGFYAGYLLAQQRAKPSWYAGDEFAAARAAALEALR